VQCIRLYVIAQNGIFIFKVKANTKKNRKAILATVRQEQ
jgi:hypothetical protein